VGSLKNTIERSLADAGLVEIGWLCCGEGWMVLS
jgi:hypothetical protein